jgi:hypothetical protein
VGGVAAEEEATADVFPAGTAVGEELKGVAEERGAGLGETDDEDFWAGL